MYYKYRQIKMKSNITKNNKVLQKDPISAEIIDRTDKLISKQLNEDKVKFAGIMNPDEEKSNNRSNSNIYVY